MAFSSRCLKIFLLCSPPAPRESRRAVECPAAVLREESAWCHPSGRCHPLSGTRETWVARFVAAFVIPIRQVSSAIRHLPSARCHLPSAMCHLPSAVCHLPSAICHLPSARCRLPSGICHLPFLLPHSPFRIPHSALSNEAPPQIDEPCYNRRRPWRVTGC